MKQNMIEIEIEISPTELMKVANEYLTGAKQIRAASKKEKADAKECGLTIESADNPLRLTFKWFPKFDKKWKLIS